VVGVAQRSAQTEDYHSAFPAAVVAVAMQAAEVLYSVVVVVDSQVARTKPRRDRGESMEGGSRQRGQVAGGDVVRETVVVVGYRKL
jgi:hypothetical protein